MIHVSVASELLPDPVVVDEFNRHVPYPVLFEQYDGPPDVPLPDFGDSLTRMVYKGWARSFMPPPAYPHRVLCAIRLDSPEELGVTEAKDWPLHWIDSRGTHRIPDRSVVILEFEAVIVYIVPGSVNRLAQIDFGPLVREVPKAESKLSSASGLGSFAEIVLGPIYLHFTLFDGEPILLDIGPHYTRRRKR